jgi:hypothetical protein
VAHRAPWAPHAGAGACRRPRAGGVTMRRNLTRKPAGRGGSQLRLDQGGRYLGMPPRAGWRQHASTLTILAASRSVSKKSVRYSRPARTTVVAGVRGPPRFRSTDLAVLAPPLRAPTVPRQGPRVLLVARGPAVSPARRGAAMRCKRCDGLRHPRTRELALPELQRQRPRRGRDVHGAIAPNAFSGRIAARRSAARGNWLRLKSPQLFGGPIEFRYLF